MCRCVWSHDWTGGSIVNIPCAQIARICPTLVFKHDKWIMYSLFAIEFIKVCKSVSMCCVQFVLYNCVYYCDIMVIHIGSDNKSTVFWNIAWSSRIITDTHGTLTGHDAKSYKHSYLLPILMIHSLDMMRSHINTHTYYRYSWYTHWTWCEVI